MNRLTTTLATIAMTLSSITTFAAPPANSPEMIAKGKTAYATQCLMCHGEKGDGNGPAGAVMKPKPRNFMTDEFKGADGKGKIKNPTAAQVVEVLKKGVKGTSMAAYAHLAENDQWAIAYYVLSLRSGK